MNHAITFTDKQKTLFERVKSLRENATKAELYFKSLLDQTTIKYIFQKAFIQGDAYVIVDFYLPKPYKLCIEIDGEYHDSESQKQKDQWKDRYLKSRKLKIIRLKNHEVYDLNLETLDISFSWLVQSTQKLSE